MRQHAVQRFGSFRRNLCNKSLRIAVMLMALPMRLQQDRVNRRRAYGAVHRAVLHAHHFLVTGGRVGAVTAYALALEVARRGTGC